MADSERVWVVTAGDYSSKYVHSVWADETEAREFAVRLPHGNEPQPFDVRHGLPEPIAMHHRQIEIGSDGAPVHDNLGLNRDEDTWTGEVELYDEVPVGVRVDARLPTSTNPSSKYGHDRVIVTVYGTDRERVEKVFTEQVVRAKAEFDVLIAAEKERRRRMEERIAGG